MKLRYAFFTTVSAVFGGNMASAQGVVTLHDEHGMVVNGTTIYHSSLPTNSTDTVSLLTTLTGADPMTVNVRRHETIVAPGTQNFYCWGVCFIEANAGAHPTWVSVQSVNLTPGATVANFHSYYKPLGMEGAAKFRFVWYNEADPMGGDSSWVDIVFGGQVGITDAPASVTNFDAWPNPSSGQDVQLDYALDKIAPGTEVVVYTMLGEQIRRVALPSTQGRLTLPVGTLATGIYFASIERKGRVLATRKLVIAR